MSTTYAIVHFWPAEGGFGKRMDMLADVLARHGDVRRISTLPALARLLVGRPRPLRILIYTSLLAPLAALLRIVCPGATIFCMVRGDEETYALHAGRRLRAMVARAMQALAIRCGCRMVFASEDLRRAFQRRHGKLKSAVVLPNTIGRSLPPTRPVDGRIAIVGDFCSVKNIEPALKALSGGRFEVHLFGNSRPPQGPARPWLKLHGRVSDLTAELAACSTVVLGSVSEGFPNVLVEALQAGCSVVAHREFPFRCLPISDHWRFSPGAADLQDVLLRLARERRDFARDNPQLISLIESDWAARVADIFAPIARSA